MVAQWRGTTISFAGKSSFETQSSTVGYSVLLPPHRENRPKTLLNIQFILLHVTKLQMISSGGGGQPLIQSTPPSPLGCWRRCE